MTDAYIVKERRLHSLIGIVAGVALLFFGLDIHFFHSLSSKVGPNHPIWIILSAVGCLIILGSLKALIAPRTLLLADSRGITIFSRGTAKVWNAASRSFDTTRRPGDTKLIPWDQIVDIGEGVMITGRDVRGPKVNVLGGSSSLGTGHTRQYTSKALQILCINSTKLEGFDILGISQTWNGYTEEDLRQMSKKDQEKVSPEDLNSGLLLRQNCLPGGLARGIAALQSMRKTNTAS